MDNSDFQLDVHWLMKLAQEIRDDNEPSLTAKQSTIDADLAHPAMSILGDLIDRCGFDIEPAFLQGYAYGLCQAGLIDDVILKAVGAHSGEGHDEDLLAHSKHEH